MTETQVRPYWQRFLIAFAASSILVFACSLSMQPHVLRDFEWLFTVALGVTIASIPGSALVSLVVRNNQLLLVLGSQVLTVATIAIWFAVRA
jgi:hypothetical protein